MAERIVVALGGNAILTDDPTAQGQIETLKETAKHLVKIIQAGHELVITHGNGPQVGNLLIQQENSDSKTNPAMPLDTCVAMTQGSIGYWLQDVLTDALTENDIDKHIATILTRVVVDQEDEAFKKPTKPIGPFYSEAEKKALEEMTKDIFIEDSGRGYRKVVPSPKPIDIVEAPVIKSLVEAGTITISVGGGGIPTVKTAKGYEGVAAVIDKDFASAKVAELIDADTLFILTGVDNVYVNYNKPNQEKLENVTVEQMKEYIAEEQFAPGSMLPKVEAAINFLENNPKGKAVITSLENIEAFFNNGSMTVIENK